jgi:protein involved in polysaccharide export with SLBB domain
MLDRSRATAPPAVSHRAPAPTAGPRVVLAPVVLALAVLAAAASAAAQAPVATADYRLGPRDGVEIEVFEVPELNTELRVADDGSITLPVLGPVPAAGLTAGELAEEIQRRLEADYVNRATVRVALTEVLSKTVTVLGAVARPGALGHPGTWTLLEALNAAGGLTADHGNHVRIQRRAANGPHGSGVHPAAGPGGACRSTAQPAGVPGRPDPRRRHPHGHHLPAG